MRLIALVLWLSFCAAQVVLDPSSIDTGARCEPFSAANVNCQGVVPVGALIYLNSTNSQAMADAAATSSASRIALVRNFDPACSDRLYPWMCVRVFRPCVWVNFTGSAGFESYALPNLTCLALCTDVNAQCNATATQFGQPPQPCDPFITYNFTATGGELISPDCTLGWNATTTCPTVCLRPDFQDETKCCAVRCPLGRPLYGKSKFRALETTNDVLGYIAFIATCITVLLFSLNPTARKFPGILIIVQGAALIMESFGTLMTSWYGVEELQCNPDRYLPCNFQGFFVSMGAQLALTYWLVLNAITCIMLWSPRPKRFLELVTRWHWLCALFVIYPILSVALTAWAADDDPGKPAGKKGVYYGPGIFPVCLGGFDAVRKYYVIWSLILVSLGTALWLASVIKLLQVHLYTRKYGTGGLQLGMHLSIILYQLLVFCTAGLFCILFLVAHQHFGGSPSNLQLQLRAYLSGETEEKPDGKFGVLYAITFIISFVALFYSLVFGLRRMHLDFIRGKVRYFSASSTKGSQSSQVSQKQPSTDLYSISKGTDADGDNTSRF